LLFNRQHLKSYLIALGILFGIIGLYYLSCFLLLIFFGPTIFSEFFNPFSPIPLMGMPPFFRSFQIGFPFSIFQEGFVIWPFWSTFALPSLLECLIFMIILIGFMLILKILQKKRLISSNILVLIIIGIVLIIASNMIKGWNIGVERTLLAYSWKDATQISNVLEFIRNYEHAQPDLNIHARSHPPGSLLVVYIFYLLLKTPGMAAIGMCVISSLFSAFFLNRILRRYFDIELSNYMTFLYLLVPAVQVYYLANIYSIVATLILGVFYFYFHPKQNMGMIGSIICLFSCFFITFMSVFVLACLFIFELLDGRNKQIFKKEIILNKIGIRDLLIHFRKIIVLFFSLVISYGLVYLILGYNYLNSFHIAILSENPEGFIIIYKPIKYGFTRLKDIMDILMFFGPVLLVLLVKGFKSLRKKYASEKSFSLLFTLPIAGIFALLILFATGAYDHGETARAAIFIYPFLLIPVAFYLQEINISEKEKYKLLFVVFFQAILMQLIGNFIW